MTIELFFMLFLAYSLYIAFRVSVESNYPVIRHWVFFLWRRKEQINITPQNIFFFQIHLSSFISYLWPYCWGKNHPFPNNSLRFQVHDYICSCPFSLRAKLIFFRKPHRAYLDPGTNRHSHFTQHKVSQITYFTFYLVKKKINHSPNRLKQASSSLLI